MKGFIISMVVVFCILCLIGYYFKQKNDEEIKKAAYQNIEQAYFEGQKDAIEGDIRIEFNESDSCYHWIKSPWNSGKKPIFDPAKNKKRSKK